MSTALKIEISNPPTPDVVHRFRNFGEDVWTQLRETCDVSLDEIDRATNTFTVRSVRKREVRTVTRLLQAAIKEHGFEGTGTITSLHEVT
jgi:hypothetical protein